MTEPSTTSFFAVFSIGLATALSGIDGNALIGAFAGASLVVASSHDLPPFKRFAYLFISFIAGYLAVPEVIQATPIKSTGVAAFLAAALSIALTLQLIERVRSFDLRNFFKKR